MTIAGIDFGNGDMVEYTYDTYGRLIRESYEDGEYVTYQYDNSGALAVVYDSESGITTTQYYDFTGRPMKLTEEGAGYSRTVAYTYDTINNLTARVETVNGTVHTTAYTYDDDNRIVSITTDGVSETYTYDTYGRVTQKVTKNGEATILTEIYTYHTAANGAPTGQIATLRSQSAGGYDVTYSYTYDKNGNILSVSDGTHTTTYVYDSANQLTRENNEAAGTTKTWTYDAGGNILSANTYAYTTGEVGTATDTDSYTYGDAAWGDLLTAYNGESLSIDSIGNLTRDHHDNVFTWKNGRQLASYKEDGNESEDIFHFEYNADGLRTKAYNGYTTYSYIYSGSKLLQMKVTENNETNTLDFTYDSGGTPQTVTYGGTTYYYATNLQGDITAILDSTGTAVVNYTYDAWGNILTATGTLAATLGTHNPLRYRGYVYDTETELYYLQSRYYNPELGRFLNADVLVTTGQGLLGNNMFAYCTNNAINKIDPTGYAAYFIAMSVKEDSTSDDTIYDSEEEAAFAAGVLVRTNTNNNNDEYICGVYELDYGGYVVGNAYRGEHSNVSPKYVTDEAEQYGDRNLVAFVHSHPYCNGHVPNEFSKITRGHWSEGDWALPVLFNMPVYLAAPNGELKALYAFGKVFLERIGNDIYMRVIVEKHYEISICDGLPKDTTMYDCMG